MKIKVARIAIAVAAVVWLGTRGRPARAENLLDAWAIALQVNGRMQAQQSESAAADWSLAAARSARYPTVRNFSFESFLTATPEIRSPFAGLGTGANGGPAAGVAGPPGTPGMITGGVPTANATSLLTGLPTAFPVLGQGQRQLPVSITFASVPLFTSGRIRRRWRRPARQLGAQRTEEFRTALDLKLTVAEAYVGVLRATRNVMVSRSNVERLASFARDVRNRLKEGLAIRSDELAAEVSLANARLGAIETETALAEAWATYNRYLCRPLSIVVSLDELALDPWPTDDGQESGKLHEQAVQPIQGPAIDESEIRFLTDRALRSRPELAGLSEQARGYEAQAKATRATVKPQASFIMGYAFVGNNNQIPQGIGSATFLLDWTLTDGGAQQRRAAALRHQSTATCKRRVDLAADVALQVRNRWLELRRARLKLPVTRLAIAQANENINVLMDRYRQQLSTYTEVLDAENRRVQSLTNFYSARYDENLALFRLRRAVGDL